MDTNNNTPYNEILCPGCSSTLKQYNINASCHYSCAKCNTFFIRNTDGSTERISKQDWSSSSVPGITIGATGNIHGHKFIVTGYSKRWDKNEMVYWDEYTLYDDANDCYYYLAFDEGAWIFVWKAEEQDINPRHSSELFGSYITEYNPYRKYEEYASFTYDITYAEGEFDSDIIEDAEEIKVVEYISNDHMLIAETDEEETLWYRGKLLSNYEVLTAFAKEDLSADTQKQLNKQDTEFLVKKYGVIMIVLIIVAQLVLLMFNQPRDILKKDFITLKDSASWNNMKTIDAGTIKIFGSTALDIAFTSQLNNEWLELDVALESTNGGTSYNFTKVIEYYSGYEGGEFWKEGSQTTHALLSNVPAGEYALYISPGSDTDRSFPIKVEVEENTVLYSNAFLAILIILLLPGFYALRKHLREQAKH